MFRNYFSTALRNLFRHKLYSAINIGGLAVGLAAAILILLFVRDEFSWDRWLPSAERIYRVELTSFPSGREPVNLAVSFTPMAPFYPREFSQVESVTRLTYQQRTIHSNGDYFSQQAAFADPNFLDVFELEMIEGQRDRAFDDPSKILVSQAMADRLFGGEAALGRTVEFNNGRGYRVGGVFRDLPANSHQDLEIVLPYNYQEFPGKPGEPSPLDEWFWLGTYVYLKLDRAASVDAVQAGLPQLLDRHGPRPNEQIVPSERWQLQLVNVRDIHLDGAPGARIKPAGSRSGALMFATIAFLILLIGCLNFINLTTAKATVRAREVAVRKVFGAHRSQLFWQFMFEVSLLVLVALGLALALVEFALPFYSAFLQKVLEMNLLSDPASVAALAGLLLIVVLGAGGQPALGLSSFRPAEVLKSGHARGTRPARLRNILVSIQFSIAIGLIIASTVVFTQVQHGLARDKGYDPTGLLVLASIADPKVAPHLEALRSRMTDEPDIGSVSFSSATPADSFTSLVGYGGINGVSVEPVILNYMSIDDQFIDTYGLHLLSGRNLDRDRSSDWAATAPGQYRDAGLLISESAMRKIGFTDPEAVIGTTLTDGETMTVVGVVADINDGSADREAKPFVFAMDRFQWRRMSLRQDTADFQRVRTAVDEAWKEIVPDVPMRASLLEETIAAQYDDQRARGLMFAVFAGLAILVASLGLYGLSSFTIEQKTKEIGMRKVLGASVNNIVRHFAWQSTKPVLWANLAAWPVAGWLMTQWLNGFSYRIDLTPAPFLLAAALTLAIALFSVGLHVWSVARNKPIRALRYE